MTKQEKEMYLNKKAIAVYPMTNHGGIEILDIIPDIDDYVVYRFNFGTPEEAHRSKIRYGSSVESFKTYAGYSIRLNDCVRV
jgi:hypothetical protein